MLLNGLALIILNSSHSIWVLLSLEMLNLGVLVILSKFLTPLWFMFIFTFQVSESVLLMALLLMELSVWSKFYESSN